MFHQWTKDVENFVWKLNRLTFGSYSYCFERIQQHWSFLKWKVKTSEFVIWLKLLNFKVWQLSNCKNLPIHYHQKLRMCLVFMLNVDKVFKAITFCCSYNNIYIICFYVFFSFVQSSSARDFNDRNFLRSKNEKWERVKLGVGCSIICKINTGRGICCSFARLFFWFLKSLFCKMRKL